MYLPENGEWINTGEQRKILSDEAKRVIKDALTARVYTNREGKMEPHNMAPSTNPDDYSQVRQEWSFTMISESLIGGQWCSLCADFGTTLLLCACCGVGV